MGNWKSLPDVETKDAPWKALPDVGSAGPGSPLDSALKSQTSDVVSVDTPGGAAQFDRQGRRILSPEETTTALDAGDARAKTAGLTRALTAVNSAASNVTPYLAGAVGAAKSIGTRESLVDAFRRNKDAATSTIDMADSEVTKPSQDPANHAGLAWQVAGKLPTALVGGPATAAGRVALNAGLAGVEGFTRSRGTLGTSEGRMQVAEDTAKGAGIGGMAGVLGEAVSYPLSRISGALSNRAASNAAKVGAEELGGMSPVTSAQVDQAVTAADKTFANPYASAASRTAAQGATQSAQQGLAATTAAEASKAARLDPTNVALGLGKALAPRAALGAAGYALGNATGIEHGGAGGAALGALAPAGALGKALSNPATASVLQGVGSSVAGGASAAIRGVAQAAGRQAAPKPDFSKPKDQRTEEAVQALLDSGF